MKVKLLVSRSGSDGSFVPGDEITVSDAEAKRMIEKGQAIAVQAPIERATKKRALEKRA